jgi:hypothetical protein
MKTLIFLGASGVLLTVLAITSCTTSKKMALPCPEPEGKYKNKAAVHNLLKAKNLSEFPKKDSRWEYFSKKYKSKLKPDGQVKTTQDIRLQNISSALRENAIPIPFNKPLYINNLYAAADLNGDILVYEKPDIIPVKTLLNPDIAVIYNTDSLVNPAYTTPTDTLVKEDTEKEAYGLEVVGIGASMIAFIHSIINLIVPPDTWIGFLPFIFGTIGIILSGICLRVFKKNPNRYKSRVRNVAKGGLIFGILALILEIVFLGVAIASII